MKWNARKLHITGLYAFRRLWRLQGSVRLGRSATLHSHGSHHPQYYVPWKHTVSFIGHKKPSFTAGTLCVIGAKICWKYSKKLLTHWKQYGIIKNGGNNGFIEHNKKRQWFTWKIMVFCDIEIYPEYYIYKELPDELHLWK
jgi:hypothetical protein